MLTIRPETPPDYAAIAAVNVRAFGEQTGEAVLVALLRQRPVFDPALSLVAERDGQIIGHVLFSPHTVQLLGEAVRAVNLAPIAIDPAHQRQGIGQKLIETGHALARRKGYAFSFLLGHTSYYPRLGYQTRAYGVATLTLRPTRLMTRRALLARRPTEADVPALRQLWRDTEGAVDFALEPGREFLDWVSPNPAIEALVFVEAEQVVGYLRRPSAERHRPSIFLARDADTARQMVALPVPAEDESELILPLHPASPATKGLGLAKAEAWDAAMVYPLRPSSFDDYFAQVSAGARPPGRVIWPTMFDLA